jgi:hypothetical protein
MDPSLLLRCTRELVVGLEVVTKLHAVAAEAQARAENIETQIIPKLRRLQEQTKRVVTNPDATQTEYNDIAQVLDSLCVPDYCEFDCCGGGLRLVAWKSLREYEAMSS